jgi:hypothetical protein
MRAVLRHRIDHTAGVVLAVGYLAFCLVCAAGWVRHVVWTIGKLASDQGATAGQMVLGAVGTFMPPIGVLHGFIIWYRNGFGG